MHCIVLRTSSKIGRNHYLACSVDGACCTGSSETLCIGSPDRKAAIASEVGSKIIP